MFGSCKLCEEKEKRISLLMAQVADLRALAYPSYHSNTISLQSQEADRILSGSDELIEITEDEAAREAASLLTGSYYTDQVETE